MTPSLHPHCILTEPVCKTMSGKGREGNKEGKGREGRGETLHHGVQIGDVGASRDAMMTVKTLRRFHANYAVTDGCWNWTATVNQKGYGRLWNGRRYEGAHRYSYELHHGPRCPTSSPAGMRPMTSTERNARLRARRSAERLQREVESGWWVAI